MVTLLDDDGAATTDVHTDPMMPMAIAVTIAVATDTEVNAGTVPAPTDPRAFTLTAAHGNAATTAFTAPFAATFALTTIAALAALAARPLARLPGLRLSVGLA